MPQGKRLLRALAGEPVWPPPLWLMRQAGRYLPEYRAIRAEAGDFIALCTTPALAAEVTLQPIRRFGMDAAILFSDILILPWALGWGLRFAEGEGPLLPRWTGSASTASLRPEQLGQRIAPVLETVRRVRAELSQEKALIGFAGGPFTVACYMAEGGGSKDHALTRYLAYTDPSGFGGLIDTLTESTITYLAAQVENGADTVMVFDSWAGVLPPTLFDRYVTQPTARIVAGLRSLGHHVPVIGFPRLAGGQAAAYAIASGVQGVGLDTGTDPCQVVRGLPSHVAIQGNLDPAALKAGGAALRQEAAFVLSGLSGRPAIFNLGHGIFPDTAPAHVAELMDIVRGG
jgi:uroporphyrinogen decarboxylase